MSVCWPTAQLRAAQELYVTQHQEAPYHDGTFQRWSAERSRNYPFHHSDGVTFWLSPIDLPDEFEWLRSVPKQADSEEREPEEDS